MAKVLHQANEAPFKALATKASDLFHSLKVTQILKDAVNGEIEFNENTISRGKDYLALKTFGWSKISGITPAIAWNNEGQSLVAKYQGLNGWTIENGIFNLKVPLDSPFCHFLTDRFQRVNAGGSYKGKVQYHDHYLAGIEKEPTVEIKSTTIVEKLREKLTGIPESLRKMLNGPLYFGLFNDPELGKWITISDENRRHSIVVDFGSGTRPTVSYEDRSKLGVVKLSNPQIVMDKIPESMKLILLDSPNGKRSFYLAVAGTC